MENKSKLTAISRKTISAPVKRLSDILNWRHRGQKGSILHHGCGRSTKDSEFLRSICCKHSYAEFDPNFAPNRMPLNDKYDTVISNFVLNVLKLEDRQEAWMDIMMCVHADGVAYITVRSNKDTSIKGKQYEDGVITSKGTFQKGYSVEDLEEEAGGFFNSVSVTSHGHYRTAVCSDPL